MHAWFPARPLDCWPAQGAAREAQAERTQTAQKQTERTFPAQAAEREPQAERTQTAPQRTETDAAREQAERAQTAPKAQGNEP